MPAATATPVKRAPDIENLTVFSDASFCHKSKAGGGAYWAKGESTKASESFVLVGALQSHDSEVMAACEAILRLADNPAMSKLLEKGPKTRLVLVVDCLTVKQVLEGSNPPLCPAAKSLVDRVRTLRENMRFWLKVNHVKAHSGQGSPRKWVNSWCDRSARARMKGMRDGVPVVLADVDENDE